MELQFRSLADVEIVEEINDNGHVLIEEDGKIKKVPKKEVGSGVPTAILQNPEYPYAIDSRIINGGDEYSFKKPSGENEETEVSEQSNDVKVMEIHVYPVCINMTFEEVYEIITSYQPINIILQDVDYDWEVPYMTNCTVIVVGENRLSVVYRKPSSDYNCELQWTPDGLDGLPS